MKKTVRKNIELGILFGLMCAIILSFARFETKCDELRRGVLRLHIIANSDNVVDQSVKLAVRDEILKSSTDIFKDCNNICDAITTANDNIETIDTIANDVLQREGFNYCAKVSVGKRYFDTRVYDNFTLPAGNYTSLIVDLGAAEGKNWWCVVFPCVCVPSAKDAALTDSVSDSAADTATNASQYEIKFKTVELYEKIKKYLQKNDKF